MNCWHCERPSHGTCVFCGRALCKDHVKSMPRILDIFHKTDSNPQASEKYYALVVTNALYCGVCKPREDPIKMEQL